jgi:hypothetical protein
MQKPLFSVLALLCCTAAIAQTSERPLNITGPSCPGYPSIKVTVEGQETQAAGIIRGGRTFLPARATLEALGGTVTWVPQQRSFYGSFRERENTVRATIGSRTLVLYRYSGTARYGAGETLRRVRLGLAPFICANRSYLPVRAVAEMSGATVNYNRDNKTVSITLPGAPQ